MNAGAPPDRSSRYPTQMLSPDHVPLVTVAVPLSRHQRGICAERRQRRSRLGGRVVNDSCFLGYQGPAANVTVGGLLSQGVSGTIQLAAGGVLQIGTGSTGGTLGVSALANNGTLVFNRSDDSSYSGVVSGSGAVVKQGAGLLAFSGAKHLRRVDDDLGWHAGALRFGQRRRRRARSGHQWRLRPRRPRGWHLLIALHCSRA